MSDESAAEPAAVRRDHHGRQRPLGSARGLPTIEGHRAGADVVKARLRDAVELGIRELTVYSFSTENWSRPAEEVTGLMRMFSERILGETPELNDEGVRMRFIGRREGVAAALLEQMDWAEAADRRERPDHALRGVQLRRARGDPRRGSSATRAAARRPSASCSTRPRCTTQT